MSENVEHSTPEAPTTRPEKRRSPATTSIVPLNPSMV
jgi:hypothetical protein